MIMKTPKIDNCSFGTLVINGKTYTDDLIVHPGGEILKPWWRKRGHQLTMDDLSELIDSSPEVIVAGTGVSGGVKPDKNLEPELSKLGIELIAAPNDEAIKIFNKYSPVTVFLDMKMPGMDGIETLRKIKSIDSNIPVIIVICWPPETQIKTAREIHQSHCLIICSLNHLSHHAIASCL